eukprot:CAMPEP_0201717744 /NCGR_PEP_ID=MMETSP0593-20130828/3428_1 /ASSEMBLY_ACC=CAM_ASM_000672 /TAXON_ID=267983 /ORGANISM="Skeletonema japonicum, Strain CCMP2506" /LENGTH=376 /DNA_ID=CAMNT_0048207879 /DNA_START=113 /DNA_END=1243 /DNA_ORIENTATION=+
MNEACSSLLESPPQRNKEPLPVYRQYGQTPNDQHQPKQHQQRQQHTPATAMCTVISPPTPDKPSAFACSPASTLKHSNTTGIAAAAAAAAGGGRDQYYREQRKMRSVSFAPTATVQPINVPKGSDMTQQEKQIIWYLGNDYIQFKNDAASDGGVTIMRHAPLNADQTRKSCHFICIGSFDGSCDVDTSSSSSSCNHSSDEATAGSKRTSPSGKFYNEHEFNDYIKENGQEVCKRGLGYHFSRIRKSNRVIVRSAVVAWQKCMQKESNKKRIEKVVQRKMCALPNSSSSRKNLQQLQQTQSIVLASVSSKCSKVSREEALWRGNIDFRVAYPERCQFVINDSIQKKRSVGSTAACHASKRRRSNGNAYSSEAEEIIL